MFAILKSQHAEIAKIAAGLEKLLTAHPDPVISELSILRTKLSLSLVGHLTAEEEHLHAPLRRSRLGAKIPRYADVADATRDLRLAYSAHIARWPVKTIRSHWADYVAETRALLGNLSQIMRDEEHDIFPLAQQLLAARAFPSESGSGQDGYAVNDRSTLSRL